MVFHVLLVSTDNIANRGSKHMSLYRRQYSDEFNVFFVLVSFLAFFYFEGTV